MIAPQPLLPDPLARLRIDAREDAEIAHDVQLVADENGRGCEGGTARDRPGLVRRRDVARSIGPDRQDLGLEESGRDVHEAVPEHRPWDIRKSVLVPYVPDFLAGLGIVSLRLECADADDLIAPADGNDQRRRIGLGEGLAAL